MDLLYVIVIKTNTKTTRNMKNLTLKTALDLGFDFENSSFETREQLEQEIVEFLNDNISSLREEEDECNVDGNGTRQYVNYGDYSASGEIIQYGPDYWFQPADKKMFHSSFLIIDEKTGEPYCMNLFQYVGENEYNTPKEIKEENEEDSE